MNMLYRIKIVDGEKFVRYLNDEEYQTIKPKRDGSGVEQADVIPYNSADEYGAYLFFDWIDVSSTHKVEWGIMTSDKYNNPIPIYDGDIYLDWNTGQIGVHDKPRIFYIYNMQHMMSEEFPIIEVIGNINQNPELLEEK